MAATKKKPVVNRRRTDMDRVAKIEQELASRLNIDLTEHDVQAVAKTAEPAPRKALSDKERITRLELFVGSALGMQLGDPE